jgi:hypothetical protein
VFKQRKKTPLDAPIAKLPALNRAFQHHLKNHDRFDTPNPADPWAVYEKCPICRTVYAQQLAEIRLLLFIKNRIMILIGIYFRQTDARHQNNLDQRQKPMRRSFL